MSEITKAIAAKQTQIVQLQSDIAALQRAASVLRGTSTQAKVLPGRLKAKRKRRKAAAAKGSPGRKTTQTRKTTWSTAEREAISRRMRAYWAKRRRARRSGG